jgi:hypothetical protein
MLDAVSNKLPEKSTTTPSGLKKNPPEGAQSPVCLTYVFIV